jgi:hypothetical protein
LHLKPDVVLGDIQGPGRALSKEARAKIQVIAPHEREVRLEKARKELLATVETLRGEMLTQKEADAVEAAIEDELIALRVGPF